MTDIQTRKIGPLDFRIHTPNLLNEILLNKGTSALEIPLKTLGHKLFELAECAAEINNPALNKIMLELTLYEIADAIKYPDQKEYREAMKTIEQQLTGTG